MVYHMEKRNMDHGKTEGYKVKKTGKKEKICIAAAGAALLLALAAVWVMLLSVNGNSSFLLRNVYVGSSGLKEEESAELSGGAEEEFSFVAYETLSDLSVYTEADAEASLTALLVNAETGDVRENTVSVPEGSALVCLFPGETTQNGRCNYVLRLKNDGDGIVRVASREGGTALSATGGPRFAALLYWGLGIGCVLQAVLWAVMTLSGASAERVFLAVSVPVCIIFSLLFYPGTVCDENDHYIEAYRLSNRILGESTKMIREEDLSIVDYRWAVPNLEGMYLAVYQTGRGASSAQMVKTSHQGHTGNKIVYLLPALGITAGRLLGRNAFTTYYLARGMNILLYLAAGYLALKTAKKGKTFLLMWALMPLVVNQCISVNQDSFCFAVSLFAAALWTSMDKTLSEGKKLSRAAWAALVATVLLLGCCKAYSLLLLMFTVLPWKTAYPSGSGRIGKLLPGGVLLGAAAAGFLLYRSGYGVRIIYAVFGRENSSRYSLRYLMEDPARGLKVFTDTVREDWVGWLRDLFGTRLSWQTYLPLIFSAFFAVLLVRASLVSDGGETEPTRAQQRMNVLLQLGLFAAVFLQACSWTNVSDPTIWGIQGRYFIPSVQFCFLLLPRKVKAEDAEQRHRRLFCLFLLTFLLLAGDLFVRHYLVFLSE